MPMSILYMKQGATSIDISTKSPLNPLRTIRIGWAENYKNKPKCSFLCVKSESKVHFFKSFLDLEILHGSYLTQSS